MKVFLAAILILSLRTINGAVPRLFEQRDFTARSFAEAVNHFVEAGEANAVKELKGLAVDRSKADWKDGFSMNERIGWMCRVLYIAKPGETLRPPRFGGLNLPYLTMPFDRWPLFPVAHSGTTYFVLAQGYSLAGLAEDPRDYLQYCGENGSFRKQAIPIPTRAQAIKDAASLRASDQWQSIKWTDAGPGQSYTMDEARTFRFIERQADTIPN